MVVFGVWEYQQNTRQIIHGNNKSRILLKCRNGRKKILTGHEPSILNKYIHVTINSNISNYNRCPLA
jgi:hypothetical protein